MAATSKPASLDPVYNAYIHNRDVPGAWITPRDRSHGPPRQPATNMSKFEGDLSHARSNYEHFHSPNNESNRFLMAATDTDRAAYRDIQRMAPYPHTPGTSIRPSSAPASPTHSRHSSPDHPSSPSRFVRPVNSNSVGIQIASLPGHSRLSSVQGHSPVQAANFPVQASSSLMQAGSNIMQAGQNSSMQAGSSLMQASGTDPDTPTRQIASEKRLADIMTTPTGSPCYTFTAYMEADLVDGKPLVGSLSPADEWRAARVLTYEVNPSPTGYGKGGSRPFHADYRHYKYYGFAGRGAKTSWAHNPKYSEVYRTFCKLYSASNASPGPTSVDPAVSNPPRQATGELSARKPLTAVEKELVRQFTSHSFSAQGAVTQQSPQQQKKKPASPAKPERAGILLPKTEIIEPYYEFVDRETRQPLPGRSFVPGSSVAQVSTYRMVAPSPLAFTHSSPNHGSQSPATQRYSHYKNHGFAGKGATSSWARNPKYEVLQV